MLSSAPTPRRLKSNGPILARPICLALGAQSELDVHTAFVVRGAYFRPGNQRSRARPHDPTATSRRKRRNITLAQELRFIVRICTLDHNSQFLSSLLRNFFIYKVKSARLSINPVSICANVLLCSRFQNAAMRPADALAASL